jgi:hypothetical protein
MLISRVKIDGVIKVMFKKKGLRLQIQTQKKALTFMRLPVAAAARSSAICADAVSGDADRIYVIFACECALKPALNQVVLSWQQRCSVAAG